jgi:DNA-binding HxlR family transcriptional regulator
MAEAEELVGFVSGNVRRRQVIEALSKGGESLEQLEKLSRIPKIMLEKILKEMEGKKIVKKTKAGYALTPDGDHLAQMLKSMR